TAPRTLSRRSRRRSRPNVPPAPAPGARATGGTRNPPGPARTPPRSSDDRHDRYRGTDPGPLPRGAHRYRDVAALHAPPGPDPAAGVADRDQHLRALLLQRLRAALPHPGRPGADGELHLRAHARPARRARVRTGSGAPELLHLLRRAVPAVHPAR